MIKKDIQEKTLASTIAELRDITAWFEAQEEVDVEEGLQKIKEGAVLVKQGKVYLKTLENQFEEIQKELGE